MSQDDHRPTPQQEAIYETVASSTANLAVCAVAGSGKSTTAAEAAKRAKCKVGFVAFNKHIADELKPKLNGAARAMTLHSLGNAACRNAFPGADLDEKKPVKTLARIRPSWTFSSMKRGLCCRPEGRATLDLARMAKLTLTGREDMPALVEECQIDTPDSTPLADICDAAEALLEAEAENTSSIDFDDQLWLPVRLNLSVERFGLLLVDEAQDMNRVQQALALKASEGGRMACIGDEKQSIYSFMGADSSSIPRMIQTLQERGGCEDRPLTVTFRCPESHVAMARRLVPYIQAAPGAIPGTVKVIEESDLRHMVKPGDMVIARRNAPLVGLTLKLLSAGIKANMVGRDLGKGMLDLINHLSPDGIRDLLTLLDDYLAAEVQKLERKDAPDSAFVTLKDRVESLRDLAAGFQSVQPLRDFIAGFGEGKQHREDCVTLSSIHRAKGLEAKRVFITDTQCLPMILTCRECKGLGCRKCRNSGTRMNAVAMEQERNLLYVAITRSKSDLYFVDSIPEILL